jgi:hypothetical protein
MQIPYVRNKFYLYGSKIILFSVFFFAAQSLVHAQKFTYAKRNNPNYDLRKLSYGFLIGIHTTTYQVKYSDKYATLTNPPNDSLVAVIPDWSPGFSLGFIVNYRLGDFFDLRTTPKFAFYEHRLKYQFINTAQQQLIETVMVELPLLMKYKSERRGNVRMYMIGGVKPGIEASGKKQIENSSAKGLEIKGTNVSLEAGFGFDLYYPLFKFSPELRFSHGIVNMLDNTTTIYGQPLKRVNTNTITLYFLFQ